jgi:hypothetical protein
VIIEKRRVFLEAPRRYGHKRPYGKWYHRKHFDDHYGEDFHGGYGRHFDEGNGDDFDYRGNGPY